jgi:hypothetical protein
MVSLKESERKSIVVVFVGLNRSSLKLKSGLSVMSDDSSLNSVPVSEDANNGLTVSDDSNTGSKDNPDPYNGSKDNPDSNNGLKIISVNLKNGLNENQGSMQTAFTTISTTATLSSLKENIVEIAIVESHDYELKIK